MLVELSIYLLTIIILFLLEKRIHKGRDFWIKNIFVFSSILILILSLLAIFLKLFIGIFLFKTTLCTLLFSLALLLKSKGSGQAPNVVFICAVCITLYSIVTSSNIHYYKSPDNNTTLIIKEIQGSIFSEYATAIKEITGIRFSKYDLKTGYESFLNYKFYKKNIIFTKQLNYTLVDISEISKDFHEKFNIKWLNNSEVKISINRKFVYIFLWYVNGSRYDLIESNSIEDNEFFDGDKWTLTLKVDAQ